MLYFVDTATGGLDYTAMQGLSTNHIDVPLVYHSKTTTSDFIPEFVRLAEKTFDITGIKPVLCIERNNGGAFLMDRLAGLNFTGKYELYKMPSYGRVNPPDAVKYGFDMNSATRPKVLSDLKDAIDKKAVILYDKQTITELYSFVITQTSSSWKAQAEHGSHDDLVISLGGVWQMYQTCEPPVTDKSLSDQIHQLPVEAWKKRVYF